MPNENETNTERERFTNDDLLGLKKLLRKHGIHHESLQADILKWAGNACNEIGIKHQRVDGTYSAGKKAGAFECRDIFLPNAGGMARELAAPDSDNSNDING